LEVVEESQIDPEVKAMTTLNDDIFMLCLQKNNDQSIRIFSRNDKDHEKAVIPLSKTCT